jgi:AcrR family transcriptional regulator
LLAAAKCFDQQGFQRTTIADIRRQAGVSTGAVYTYFRSKDAIVRALLDDAQGARRARLREAAPARAGEQSADDTALLDWAQGLFSTQGRHVARVNIQLWAEALRDRAIGELARCAVSEATDAVAERVARVLSSRGSAVAGADPRALAALLVSISLGIEVQLGIGVKVDAERVTQLMAALFGDAPARAGSARRSRHATPRRTRSSR